MLDRKSGSLLVTPTNSDTNMVGAGSDGLSHDDAHYFLYPKPPVAGRRRTSITGKTSPGFSEQLDGGNPHGFRHRMLARRGSAPEVNFGLPPIEDRSRKMCVLSKSSSKLSLEKLNTSLADGTTSSMSHVTHKGGVRFASGDRNDFFDKRTTLLGARDNGLWDKPLIMKEKSEANQYLNNSNQKTNYLRSYNSRRRLSSSPTCLQRVADEFKNDLTLSSKKYTTKFGEGTSKDKNMNIVSKNKQKEAKRVMVEDDDDEEEEDSVDEEFNQRILSWIDNVQKATRNPFILSDDEDDDVSRETAIRIIHTGD